MSKYTHTHSIACGVRRAQPPAPVWAVHKNKGLVTNYGEGGATQREGGAREVLPLEKGGAEKVLAVLKGGAQKVLG